ncbi:TOMM precursor leader peptide-binding protein [Actinacidiphila acididurans]|uniref:TOMM precursor leader peptide-binding protein n=1 Tax=Actinacidiphila acididurans TaxID=2784346 RepID=UPI0027DCB053|nr:TOMM precursor leader peptide-binding protein [Actinacidiphila acididurans]
MDAVRIADTDPVLGQPLVAPLGVRDELGVAAGQEAGVYVYGHHALVGPYEAGGGAGCGRCLVRRWQAVRTRGLREAIELGADTAAAGTAPWAVPFVADALAAVVAANAGPGGPGPAADGFPYAFLVDLETLAVTRFAVVPDAECPACGVRPADSAEGARIVLDDSPKTAPGAFRVRPADDYAVPLEAYVNPAAGMLGPSVVPDLVSGSTSSTVGSFFLRSGDYLRECFWGGHTPRYRSSVRVGVLEGLERFAGMRPRGKRTAVTAAYDDVRDTALDPRICGLYDDEFHRSEPHVRPFDPARPIPWVWGWSLRDQRPLLVPEITAYYHALGGLAHRFVQESSNGCASGGTLAEAVYFGLMEVIERDAFLLAWYGQAPLTEIDAGASTGPETRAMIDRLAMYGYRARFFDTRVTFPVPVVTAVAEREDGGPGRLCFGAGASLDPEAALSAGLCEIATDAVNLRRRTLREQDRLRAMAADFSGVQVLHDHPLLYGLPEMAPYADFLLRQDRPRMVTPAALARDTITPGADTGDDVTACVAAVSRAGFDVVVVDQTMPEQRRLGFHTAGVIVPGLLPIDFGWRRQRARHMPRMRTALAEAGLRPGSLGPADLNPAPHPFP